MIKNQHNESTKMILALLIGGIIGAGALYYIYVEEDRKTPILKKIGKTISDVGNMLENCNLEECGADMINTFEKKLPQGSDLVSSFTDWLDNGLTLWKKFKKG